MKNAATPSPMLKGVPVWKCSTTNLRNYCEENNISLEAGLKQFHLVKIVKEHISANGTAAETLEAVPGKTTEKKKSSGKKSATPSVKKDKKDFVLEKPATATEKKIAEMDIMYSIKAWKLHGLGRNPEEIMAITGRWDKPSSTPRIIAEYGNNAKLRERADAITVS